MSKAPDTDRPPPHSALRVPHRLRLLASPLHTALMVVMWDVQLSLPKENGGGAVYEDNLDLLSPLAPLGVRLSVGRPLLSVSDVRAAKGPWTTPWGTSQLTACPPHLKLHSTTGSGYRQYLTRGRGWTGGSGVPLLRSTRPRDCLSLPLAPQCVS